MTERINKEAALASGSTEVSAEELRLINGYARKPLSADEVYVFSLILCDNDVDRDGERFTVESLFALEKLFVGKTGIFDHDPSAKNQTARIFSCRVEAEEGRKTATGDDYFMLKARAYMLRTKENEAVIRALDSGILREVSVGCAVREVRCSICGEAVSSCTHQKGEKYSGKLCCGELTDPYDAYEFSFVAVPAQRAAGVTKSAYGKEGNMEAIIKRLGGGSGVTLDKSECQRLCDYIGRLSAKARDGEYYRDSLISEVLRLSAAVQPGISRATMESVAKEMSIAQLNEFKNAYEKKLDESFAPSPQLCGGRTKNAGENGQFTI